MAAASKRRTSSRTKTQKTAKIADAKQPLSARTWLRDVSTLLLIAAGFFLLVSVGSYSWLMTVGGVVIPQRNTMGPLGHVAATLLFGTLGWACFIPVGGLFWLAFFRPRTSEEQAKRYPIAVSGTFFFLLVAAFAGLLSLLSGYRGLGGSCGGWIATNLTGTVGSGGSLLAVALAVAVSMAILSQRSVGDVAHGLRWIVQECAKLSLLELPKLSFAASKWVGRSVGNASVSVVHSVLRLGFRRGPNRPAVEPPLPKPRVRRNLVPNEESVITSDKIAHSSSSMEQPPIERADPIIVKPKLVEGSKADKSGKRGKKVTLIKEDRPGFDDYTAPDITLLTREDNQETAEDDEELRQKAEQIESKLRDFNIAGRVTQVHPGPVITLFEFEPAPGVKVGRIAALQDDLAMSLRASSIRIIAPIPKRGTVGIEVPNKHQAMVRLRDCLESPAFTNAESILSIPLGKDTYGDAMVVDIAAMPHLLMAGATGTGKSVSINVLLLSLLYRAHPSELGLILIDPKVLELSIYDGIPHLRVPVVTDPRQAKAVLSWAVKEMDRRYRYMQKFGVRNIDGYNKIVSGEATPEGAAVPNIPPGTVRPEPSPTIGDLDLSNGNSAEESEGVEDAEGMSSLDLVAPEELKPMQKIVIVIDELADLMLTVGREIEELITRLAQKARAAGIHLIIATQRPSVDVITGLIKANFPARVSFRVSSRIDSRTILDSMGAEKLLGKGDMLFMLPGAVPLKRVHGAFVSDNEVQRVVNSIKGQCQPQYDEDIIAACEKALKEESSSGESGGGDGEDADYDPFYDKAVELVLEKGQASTSMVQRTFRIGYNRAARIIEMMEREGIVGKMDGVKPREILLPTGDRVS
jgi:S-DNA-T family DNA segregation ATPase FtsK/SpoIIIE